MSSLYVPLVAPAALPAVAGTTVRRPTFQLTLHIRDQELNKTNILILNIFKAQVIMKSRKVSGAWKFTLENLMKMKKNFGHHFLSFLLLLLFHLTHFLSIFKNWVLL